MSVPLLRHMAVMAVFTGIMLVPVLSAHAQTSRLYFAGYLGLNTFNDQEFSESSRSISGDIELDNALSYAGAIGLRLSRNFRLETELSFRSANQDRIIFNGGDLELGGEMRSWIGLFNLYYDFDVDWNIQPYLGAGIGFGWHDGEFESSSPLVANVSDDTTGIAWQLGGGAKYRINPHFAFSGSYRYLDSADLDFGSYDLDFGSHEFRLGFEYDFPVE